MKHIIFPSINYDYNPLEQGLKGNIFLLHVSKIIYFYDQGSGVLRITYCWNHKIEIGSLSHLIKLLALVC